MQKGFDLKCGAGKTARVWLQGKGGGLTPGQALLYDEYRFLLGDGGLMFYGADIDESTDRVAAQVDRILKGAKPHDLPFEQPRLFKFVINAKTTKALGLEIPPSIRVLADEVIE